MEKNKTGAISLLKVCQRSGVNYMGVYNNLKKKPEYRTFKDEQIEAIFKQLDKEVKEFKARFYE